MIAIAVKLRPVPPLSVELAQSEPLRIERLSQSAPRVTLPGLQVIHLESADVAPGDGIAVSGSTINLDIASLPLAPTN